MRMGSIIQAAVREKTEAAECHPAHLALRMSPALALRTAKDRINPATLAADRRDPFRRKEPGDPPAVPPPQRVSCSRTKGRSMKNLILAGLIFAGLAACTTSSPPPA